MHDKIELARFGCVVVIWVWYCKLYNCVVANGGYDIDNFVACSSSE